MMLYRLLTYVAALCMLGLPLGAAAGGDGFGNDAPGNATTKFSLPVSPTSQSGYYNTTTDDDWYRVRLKRGVVYAVGLSGAVDCCLTSQVNLRDSRGHVLATANSATGGDTDGFEFQAPYSGLYFLEYKVTYGDPEDCCWFYSTSIAKDCLAGIATKCSLGLGQKTTGYFSFNYDKDWYRVALRGGQVYSVTTQMPPGNDDAIATIMNAEGKKVAGGTGPSVTGFRAPTSGTYYVRVGSMYSLISSYTVLLSSP